MKKLFLFIVIPLLTVIVAIAALLFFVNPNQFKPLIIEQAKKQTGLELVIDGDISWKIFPSLGLSIGKTTLVNPADFSAKNLFKVEQADINVSVLPLLSHELYIGKVILDGAEINLETLKDGRTNLDSLIAKNTPSTEASTTSKPTAVAPEKATEKEGKSAADWSINLAGVDISNAQLEINDRQTGSNIKLYDVALTLSDFAFDQWAEVNFNIKGIQDKRQISTDGKTEFILSKDMSKYAIRNTVVNLAFDDGINQIEHANLTLDHFDFGQWAKVSFLVKGGNKAQQQKFNATGGAEFTLSADLAQYALRNVSINAGFSDPLNQIEQAKIELKTFELDKANSLNFNIKGRLSDMGFAFNGHSNLQLDKALSKVNVTKLVLDSTLDGTSLPQSPLQIDLQSDLSFDINKSQLDVIIAKLTANALQFNGKANVTLAAIPKIRFSLYSPEIDLDQLLKLNQDTTTATTSKENSENKASATTKTSVAKSQEIEPDLSALKTLDVKGDVTIDKFKANNIAMQKMKVQFAIDRGVAELTSFSSNLYQGSLTAKGRLDAKSSPAHYQFETNINKVKINPLLKVLVDNDMLEGTGSVSANLKGKGLTPSAIKNNLIGTVDFTFVDGAVKGINVAHIIRSNYAKYKGVKEESIVGPQQTDFSAITASLVLNQGVVSTQDLKAQSPLLRISGKGSANYVKETVDFLIQTSIVGTLEGQGGKDLAELKDITIPINISGSWSEPKYKLVFSDVLKQKVNKELDRAKEKVEKELGKVSEKTLNKLKINEDKTKEKVNGLLKGLLK